MRLTVEVVAGACTGYDDRELTLEVNGGAFKLQAEDSPPVIDRALAYGIDTAQPVATFRPAQPRIYSAHETRNRSGCFCSSARMTCVKQLMHLQQRVSRRNAANT